MKAIGRTAIGLFILAALGCGSKLGGTFTGTATVYGGGYSDESISDVSVTLENKNGTQYYVTFGANSPIQCKLLLDNLYAEDKDTSNDNDLLLGRIRDDNTCEFKGKDGTTKRVKVDQFTGGRNAGEGGYLSLDVRLATEPTGFNFSFRGQKK